MNEVLLKVDGVSKGFPNSGALLNRFSALMRVLIKGQPPLGTDVLHDIHFEVRRGESLAIIGANGAGKSTLLKLITGVLEPSCGSISSKGTNAALLELGAGFDPECTGLENVKMNAALMNIKRKELDQKLDQILEFADIGDAIEEPVKHYSSGMVVRLGFAVVAAIKPDLLITDEILAVGDESFQKKCIRWIEEYISGGGTLLMVSHNMYQIQKLCQHAIWLDGGTIRQSGDVFDVTQRYLAWHEAKEEKRLPNNRPSVAKGQYTILDTSLNHQDMEQEVRIQMGEDLLISVSVQTYDQRIPVVLIGLIRADGTPIYGVATDHDGHNPEISDGGIAHVVCFFPSLPLLPGSYRVRTHVLDPEGLRIHDSQEREFLVTGKTRALGFVRLQHEWKNE